VAVETTAGLNEINRQGMTMMKPSIGQVLNGLDQRTLLGCLTEAQHRIDFYERLQGLVQARLASLICESPSVTPEELLTVDEAAKRLRLTRARVYELVRQKMLPKVHGLGTQVRIPASAFTGQRENGLKIER
jgi:excisionase family DNA binding protein